MPATKLQLNWTAVGFTPTAGVLTTIAHVQNVHIDPGGELLPYSGGLDRFPTVIVNAYNNPSATVESGDIATMQGFSPGTVGIFTATHSDAELAAGGAIVYTLSNAIVKNNPSSGAHRQYGSGSLSFLAYSSDGVTNPLAFTRV